MLLQMMMLILCLPTSAADAFGAPQGVRRPLVDAAEEAPLPNAAVLWPQPAQADFGASEALIAEGSLRVVAVVCDAHGGVALTADEDPAVPALTALLEAAVAAYTRAAGGSLLRPASMASMERSGSGGSDNSARTRRGTSVVLQELRLCLRRDARRSWTARQHGLNQHGVNSMPGLEPPLDAATEAYTLDVSGSVATDSKPSRNWLRHSTARPPPPPPQMPSLQRRQKAAAR